MPPPSTLVRFAVLALLLVPLPAFSQAARAPDAVDRSRLLRETERLVGEGRCRTAMEALDAADLRWTHLRADAPNHVRLTLVRADALACLGRTSEAADLLKHLLGPEGQDLLRLLAHERVVRGMIHANLSQILLRGGDPETALRVADAAIGAIPELPNGHLSRGMALEAMGRDAEAVAAYRAVLRYSTPGRRNPTWVAHAEERIRALERRHGVPEGSIW